MRSSLPDKEFTMALKQNVGRIDHVAILVSPENFETCVERMSRVLEVKFVRARRKDLGLLIAMDWDAGLEILAPTGPDSLLWSRLQTKGEGHVSIIFGVKDLDAAKARAEAEGLSVGPEVGLIGEEPWAARFEVLREAALGDICGTNISLGQVEPHGETGHKPGGPVE
jgi:hypothetical protein